MFYLDLYLFLICVYDHIKVIQRRLDGSVNFTRNWEDYRDGFGFLNREFWIGNEKLSYLTNQKRYTLRIDIKNSTNHEMFLSYDDFSTSDEWGKYQLTRLGNFTGNTDFSKYRISLICPHI